MKTERQTAVGGSAGDAGNLGVSLPRPLGEDWGALPNSVLRLLGIQLRVEHGRVGKVLPVLKF